MYVLEFLSQHRAQCVCCPKIIITSTFSTFPFPIITQLVSLVLSKRSIILKNLLLSLLFGYRSRVFSGEQRLVGRGLVVCIIRYGENFVSQLSRREGAEICGGAVPRCHQCQFRSKGSHPVNYLLGGLNYLLCLVLLVEVLVGLVSLSILQ